MLSRTATIGGVRVAKGEFMALVDDDLKHAANSPEEAVIAALKGLGGKGELVTLYYGGGTRKKTAEDLARNIRGLFSSYEVEVVYGGQPHYDYIASVE